MAQQESIIQIRPRCISVWKNSWAKRAARVTLLVDFEGQFAIVADASRGFWFLPGGGVEKNESIKEAAKREAGEELGLTVKVSRIIKAYHVTLSSTVGREQLRIPAFIAVRAGYIGGRLKTSYAPNRRILLAKKHEFRNLLADSEVPEEYEWMKPYFYVSKEIVREFVMH